MDSGSRRGALEGKLAVVTGGSSGIGAASVRLLAAEGARVVVGYNAGRERAEALCAELPGSGHLAMQIPLEDHARLVDVNLKGSSGLDVARALSAHGTSILFISGDISIADDPEIRALNPVAILEKPCMPDLLTQALQDAAARVREARLNASA